MATTRTLHGRLQRARLDAGFASVGEVARTAPVSATALREYESGEKKPGSAALVALCGRYGVSADWLLGLEPKRRKRVTRKKRFQSVGSGEQAHDRRPC